MGHHHMCLRDTVISILATVTAMPVTTTTIVTGTTTITMVTIRGVLLVTVVTTKATTTTTTTTTGLATTTAMAIVPVTATLTDNIPRFRKTSMRWLRGPRVSGNATK